MKQMVLNIIIVTYQMSLNLHSKKEIDICWITKTRKFDFNLSFIGVSLLVTLFNVGFCSV